MNLLRSLFLASLSCLFLTGCFLTSDAPKSDTPLTSSQQKRTLSQSRPPQQFGFAVHRTQNGIAYSGNCRLHPNHLATEDLEKDHIPVIKVQGRSKRNKMNVLIDFASATSWLEFSESQKFKAFFMGIGDMAIPYRGSSNTGGQNAYAGVITQLRIDNLFIENIPFYIRMATGSIGPLNRGIEVPEVDAVLGYDNLQEFEYIQINLRESRVTFSSTIPYFPHDELLITTAKIVKSQGHGLAIEGAIFGKPTPILLDFAGDFNFTRNDAKVNTTKQVSLGDLVFRQVPTLVMEPHDSPPRAGRQMLEPFIVTICSSKGIVYFERPPE